MFGGRPRVANLRRVMRTSKKWIRKMPCQDNVWIRAVLWS